MTTIPGRPGNSERPHTTRCLAGACKSIAVVVNRESVTTISESLPRVPSSCYCGSDVDHSLTYQ